MLKKTTYTKQELVDIFHSSKMCNITRTLDSLGYEYKTNGRKGDNYRLTITKTPDAFKAFCVEELGIPQQSDFRLLKNFFYYFFCDEDFAQLPITEMERILKSDGLAPSRQTLTKWIQFLKEKNIIHKSNEYNYFATVSSEISTESVQISKELYLKAWEAYWSTKRKGGSYEEACAALIKVNGGRISKKPKIEVNGFYSKLIDTLVETLEMEG